MKKVIILLLCMVMFICPCAAQAAQTEGVYDVLRLHVVADSDDAADQEIKLKVRDALIAEYSAAWEGALNAHELYREIRNMAPQIKQSADRVLNALGADYGAQVDVGIMYFPTRMYEGYLCPAGDYYAVRVRLGDAEGKNWWCVMYPSLCIAPEYDAADASGLRSKLWEWLAPEAVLEKHPTFGAWLTSIFNKGAENEKKPN